MHMVCGKRRMYMVGACLAGDYLRLVVGVRMYIAYHRLLAGRHQQGRGVPYPSHEHGQEQSKNHSGCDGPT